MRKTFFIGIFCLLCTTIFAQIDLRDSVDIETGNKTTNDALVTIDGLQTETKDSVEKKHSPKTAAILSTILPGAGQIYNGSWWKAPILYAGFAGIGYGLYFYQDYYKSFKTAYNNYRNPYLEQGLTPPSDTVLTVRGEAGYSPINVQQGRDFYRKYRDLCIFGIGALYILNILDSYVEAHLFEFDVSDDLSIQWQPTINYTALCRENKSMPAGIRFSMQF
ncbi:MAG: DUF5683 domain-containing protein [Bacteroidales bacterium]|nr:DUF5683 domain-containing protein [Bacteroidales bacterium]